MIPNKLKYGDEIRVIAPSSSLSRVRKNSYEQALSYLEGQGFKVTFSKNSREMDEFMSSEITSRVEDIHEAFADANVKMIITCI
ncbi:MAG: LD-carboxypeptidase, partial [Lachnospiraceae bacterium]|nr:LD-carboxypeptidase [Lachnospiraceae bacterium]